MKLCLLLVMIGCAASVQPQVTQEWEHGFRTKHVTATRYNNPDMGYNIGFKFPLNPADCDREEIYEFIRSQNGYIYQGGGSWGAEAYVVFKDVHNQEEANRKLHRIMPAFERVVARFQ